VPPSTQLAAPFGVGTGNPVGGAHDAASEPESAIVPESAPESVLVPESVPELEPESVPELEPESAPELDPESVHAELRPASTRLLSRLLAQALVPLAQFISAHCTRPCKQHWHRGGAIAAQLAPAAGVQLLWVAHVTKLCWQSPAMVPAS